MMKPKVLLSLLAAFFLAVFLDLGAGCGTKEPVGPTINQMDQSIADTSYINLKYFLITREFIPGAVSNGVTANLALPQNYSEQIWIDPGTGALPPPGNVNFIGFFEHWIPGRDYTIDYSTGVITFFRPLTLSCRIAVAFTKSGGVSIGFNGSGFIDVNPLNLTVPDDGIITNGAHLIKDNVSPAVLSPLALVNYYDLRESYIVPPAQDPDFLFQIIDKSSGTVLQTGQGQFLAGAAKPWVYKINQNILTVTNGNFLAPGAPASFLFPERPFANLDATGGSGPNDVYSQNTTPTSLYTIHLRFKTQR